MVTHTVWEMVGGQFHMQAVTAMYLMAWCRGKQQHEQDCCRTLRSVKGQDGPVREMDEVAEIQQMAHLQATQRPARCEQLMSFSS